MASREPSLSGGVFPRLWSLVKQSFEQRRDPQRVTGLRDTLLVLTGELKLGEVELPTDLRSRVAQRPGPPCVLLLDGRAFEPRIESQVYGAGVRGLWLGQERVVYLQPSTGDLGLQVVLSSFSTVAEHLQLLLTLAEPIEPVLSPWPEDVPAQPVRHGRLKR